MTRVAKCRMRAWRELKLKKLKQRISHWLMLRQLLRNRPLHRARCAISDVPIAWSCVLSRSNRGVKTVPDRTLARFALETKANRMRLARVMLFAFRVGTAVVERPL